MQALDLLCLTCFSGIFTRDEKTTPSPNGDHKDDGKLSVAASSSSALPQDTLSKVTACAGISKDNHVAAAGTKDAVLPKKEISFLGDNAQNSRNVDTEDRPLAQFGSLSNDAKPSNDPKFTRERGLDTASARSKTPDLIIRQRKILEQNRNAISNGQNQFAGGNSKPCKKGETVWNAHTKSPERKAMGAGGVGSGNDAAGLQHSGLSQTIPPVSGIPTEVVDVSNPVGFDNVKRFTEILAFRLAHAQRRLLSTGFTRLQVWLKRYRTSLVRKAFTRLKNNMLLSHAHSVEQCLSPGYSSKAHVLHFYFTRHRLIFVLRKRLQQEFLLNLIIITFFKPIIFEISSCFQKIKMYL